MSFIQSEHRVVDTIIHAPIPAGDPAPPLPNFDIEVPTHSIDMQYTGPGYIHSIDTPADPVVTVDYESQSLQEDITEIAPAPEPVKEKLWFFVKPNVFIYVPMLILLIILGILLFVAASYTTTFATFGFVTQGFVTLLLPLAFFRKGKESLFIRFAAILSYTGMCILSQSTANAIGGPHLPAAGLTICLLMLSLTIGAIFLLKGKAKTETSDNVVLENNDAANKAKSRGFYVFLYVTILILLLILGILLFVASYHADRNFKFTVFGFVMQALFTFFMPLAFFKKHKDLVFMAAALLVSYTGMSVLSQSTAHKTITSVTATGPSYGPHLPAAGIAIFALMFILSLVAFFVVKRRSKNQVKVVLDN